MQDKQDWTDGLILSVTAFDPCLEVEFIGLCRLAKIKPRFGCWFYIVCLVVVLFVKI